MASWRDETAVKEKDAALRDALRNSRDSFSPPPGVYLCGNSLGPQPLLARRMLTDHLEKWRLRAVCGHFEGDAPWAALEDAPAKLSLALVGARHEHEIAYMNSLTVNIHLFFTALYAPTAARRKILFEAGAFPSDEHALRTHVAARGLDPADVLLRVGPRRGEHLLREEDLLGAIGDHADELALVFLPGVVYSTGQVLPMAALCAAARDAGVRIGFDLAHAVGNIELQLHEWGADFAVWCTYKYLNSGPGAVAGAFLHDRHANSPLPRLGGWWGVPRETRFAMGPEFVPQPGARGFQLSNVPVFSLVPVIASLTVLRDAGGVKKVREQSVKLTKFMEEALDDALEGKIEIVSPREPDKRGCQLSLRICGGAPVRDVEAALLERNVFCDVREPDLLRVAAAPLFCTYSHVVEFVHVLAEILGGDSRRESCGVAAPRVG